METKKLGSCFSKNRGLRNRDSVQAKDGIKVLIVGICALLALGLFTSSEQLNAG
jgi:hypothetical protein